MYYLFLNSENLLYINFRAMPYRSRGEVTATKCDHSGNHCLAGISAHSLGVNIESDEDEQYFLIGYKTSL